MSGYIGCSEPFAEAFDQMDISPFVDIEEQGTLVFRPYSKNTSLWADDTTEILVDAWTNPDNMEEDLKQAADNMNQILADE